MGKRKWSCDAFVKDAGEYARLGKMYDGIIPSCQFLMNGFTQEDRDKAQKEDSALKAMEKQGTDYDEEPEDEDDYYEEDPDYEDEE